MKPKILVSAPYFLPVVERFRGVFNDYNLEIIVPEVHERLNEDELLRYVEDISGTICGDDAYTRKVLDKAKKLKVISKWGTGIDSIDREYCSQIGVQVKNTPNAFTEPVADTTLGYMLSFARSLYFMDKRMKAGEWHKIPSHTLRESKVGIIGFGNIGQAVARRLIAFGAKIYAHDIRPLSLSSDLVGKVELVDKNRIFSECDYITLHTDLNPSSQHLINRNSIQTMKTGVYLINTSRGPVVREQDLIEGLQTKKIAGAALDVFEFEPLPQNSPLLKMDNVFIAPHNSNSSPEAWERVHQNTIKNLIEGLGLD